MQQERLIDLNDYYTTDQAERRLAERAGRPIGKHYARDLVKQGKIRSLDLGLRARLYLKQDIDEYIFTRRGRKLKHPAQYFTF